MTTLFVLDVEDFRPLAEAAGADGDLTIRRRGPYITVTSPTTITIDRKSTGTRNAVWFSAIAAIKDGRVVRWDKTALVIEPAKTT